MLSQFIDLYYYFQNIIMRYTFEYILSACLNYHILVNITSDLNINVNTTWLMSQTSRLKVFQSSWVTEPSAPACGIALQK